MTMIRLDRHYVEKPWGRTDLPAAFGAGDARIGEVWYDTPAEHGGAKLPLLLKWLFTSEKLSIQVHPSDAQAREVGEPSGKEECWIVTATEGDARIGMGTLRPLTGDELREASLSGDIEALMDWRRVQAGDWFYIPAGTVHAIGAGVTLVEMQQNADITYRLYDYGRPRELHLDRGVAVSDAKPYAEARSGSLGEATAEAKLLVDGPHFRMWHGLGSSAAALNQFGPLWVVPLEGDAAGQVFYGNVSADDELPDGPCLISADYA